VSVLSLLLLIAFNTVQVKQNEIIHKWSMTKNDEVTISYWAIILI